jgi:hypothetical protein
MDDVKKGMITELVLTLGENTEVRTQFFHTFQNIGSTFTSYYEL